VWRSPFGANGYMASSLPLCWRLPACTDADLRECGDTDAGALCVARREIAIRQSLGAGRLQLVRQMVMEGAAISLSAGGLALLLTSWTAHAFECIRSAEFEPIALNGALDSTVEPGHASSAGGKPSVRRIPSMAFRLMCPPPKL